MNLKKQILALEPKNEHHYLWPAEKAAYREGIAETKKAAAALVGVSEVKPVARLIGWRTDDYLHETADRDMALNWEPNCRLLPIFEGDTLTKLTTPPQADQKLREALELASSHIDPTLSGDLYREVQAKIDTALAALPAPKVKS